MDVFSFPGGLGRTCAKGSDVREFQSTEAYKEEKFLLLENTSLPLDHRTPSHPMDSIFLYVQHHGGIPSSHLAVVIKRHGLPCHKELQTEGGNDERCGGVGAESSRLRVFQVDLGVERKAGPASLLTLVISLQPSSGLRAEPQQS